MKDIQPDEKPAKSPVLAALLNLWPIPLGLGYAYLGSASRLICIVLLEIFFPVLLSLLGLHSLEPYAIGFLAVVSAIHAYVLAENQNQ